MKRSTLTPTLVMGLVFLASLAWGQFNWNERPSWYSDDSGVSDAIFTMSVALADLDEDGDMDLVAGNYHYPYQFNPTSPENLQLENIGGGLFAYENAETGLSELPTNFIDGHCVDGIAVADYDKDGDLDVALGLVVGKGKDGGVMVAKNQLRQGAQTFQSLFSQYMVWESSESYDCSCVRWADFDCDGDLDLAALEVTGIVHIYENVNGNLSPNYTYDLSGNSVKYGGTSAGSGTTDDLNATATDYELGGTTMEFGDIDHDGWPDVFVNVDFSVNFGLSKSVKPYIFKNLGATPYYDFDQFYPHLIPRESDGKEGTECGSFGWWQSTSGEKFALVVAGNGQHCYRAQPIEFQIGSTEHEGLDPAGVNIYTLEEEGGELQLKDQWDSQFSSNWWNERWSRQYYTDIQWADLDNNAAFDIVATSYPLARKPEGEDLEWIKGVENVFLNPQDDYIPDWATVVTDLSTSLSLGDLDRADLYDVYETFDVSAYQSKGWVHLHRQPIDTVLNVAYSEDGINYSNISTEDYCYNENEGWVSFCLEVGGVPMPGVNYLQVHYFYSQHLDLAVGNDGDNAVYEYSGSVQPNYNEPVFTVNELNTNRAYSDGIPNEEEVNLMDQDYPLGSTFEAGVPVDFVDYILDNNENLNLVGIHINWPAETLRGHYYWNAHDLIVDTIYHAGRETFIAGWYTAPWTRGNFDPWAVTNDVESRTADERLHTHFVHNLVNRYRPGGICAQPGGYNWISDDWGVEIFQFENEPNLDDWGYGWINFGAVPPPFDDPIIIDLAEKMYREYQMIKEISSNAYPIEGLRLKVVTPNWGNFAWGGYYSAPAVPYLNKLNSVTLPIPPYNPTEILWKYCDYISQQMYCTKLPPGATGWFYPTDPFKWEHVDPYPQEEKLRLGIEHHYWGYYTEGLDDYYEIPCPDWDWSPVLDENHEHPFFVMEFNFNSDEVDWATSEVAELFTVDVFPKGPHETIDHYLLKYCAPGWAFWTAYTPGARMMDTMSKLLTGTTFSIYSYEYFVNNAPAPDALVKVVYKGSDLSPYDYVDIIRTYTTPKTGATNFPLSSGLTLSLDARIPVYETDGNYMDRGVSYTEIPIQTHCIEFAANELRPDNVLLVQEVDLESGSGNYSQAIQLERGWNLVSWYILPPDPTPENDLFMDDLFEPPDPPPPEGWWFDYNQQEPVDKVGKYDESPFEWRFFPEFGYGHNEETSWKWSLRESYPIYLESPAHFWEFTARPLYDPIDPYENFTPSDAWDNYWQVGLGYPYAAEFWYFISYPIRKQLDLFESNTIRYLVDYEPNPLMVIKDDEGNFSTLYEGYPRTLRYLKPGKGYYLGFDNNNEIVDCPWFLVGEGPIPENVPPEPKVNQKTISSGSSGAHFQFKLRTHWSYPILIDTVAVEGMSPDPGDEIAVFDGDLCVGAVTFDGQYPIHLAAWEDDIATLNEVDGYIVDNEMTFVWYDASENQEITFVQPPQTQANQPEADPRFPTHSGFGRGFYAIRSLAYGVQSINQLPQEYKLGQNYPNPFNSETVIPLELPQRAHVKIALFNLRGQNLGLIYHGVKNAGWAKIRYIARNLPSGVYFYMITANGLERGGKFQDVGKMLLLK